MVKATLAGEPKYNLLELNKVQAEKLLSLLGACGADDQDTGSIFDALRRVLDGTPYVVCQCDGQPVWALDLERK